MSASPYITCRELIDFIADYLEGALSAVQADDFRRHLAICVSCRAYLATYQVTIRAVRDLDAADVDAPEDLVRAILRIRRAAGGS
jgi:predicted anti-sigma-YlaC factor YlaD